MKPQKEQRKDKQKKRGGDPYEKISRTLSAILRHKADSMGFQIDAAGFVPLQEIIAHLRARGFKEVDEDVIQYVVDNNDKKRFQFGQKGGRRTIRATQGHSIKVVETDKLLTRITDPTTYPVVIHGTFSKFWPLIKAGGLKRMTRNHIHFAPGMPKEQGVISGMRKTCDVYIQIDMFKAFKDGVQFFISSNNVILTEGVDGTLLPQYFKRVISTTGQVLFANGGNEEMQQVGAQKEEGMWKGGAQKEENGQHAKKQAQEIGQDTGDKKSSQQS